MKPPGPWIIMLALFAALVRVEAREWTSADGKKTFEAVFSSVQGDRLVLTVDSKPAAYPLAAFSASDQQFAKNAQAIADSAAKWGPQSFEFAHPAEDGSGWICRLALPAAPKAVGPRLFTGEAFFLATPDVHAHQKGQRMENQLLFGAGGRTYHPLQGAPSMVRAFALDAEGATTAWSAIMTASGGDPAKQAPNVVEPDVEIATRLGFGVVIGKGGLVAVDPGLVVKGFKSLAVHHDGKDHPAVVVRPKDKDGVDLKLPDIALITCGVPVEPARIGTKRIIEVGQNVFAISYELNAGKKGFYTRPAVTRGIVSRLGTDGTFQHDARLSPEHAGGYLVGEKGDVLGFFFQSQAAGRSSASKSSPGGSSSASALGTAVSTQAVAGLLEKMPGQTGLKNGSVTDDMEANGKELLASSVLVTATFEIIKPRKLPAPSVAGAGGAPLPAGWSLSKSGTRHNAKCRYYNPQNPCQATEGSACKVCGG